MSQYPLNMCFFLSKHHNFPFIPWPFTKHPHLVSSLSIRTISLTWQEQLFSPTWNYKEIQAGAEGLVSYSMAAALAPILFDPADCRGLKGTLAPQANSYPIQQPRESQEKYVPHMISPTTLVDKSSPLPRVFLMTPWSVLCPSLWECLLWLLLNATQHLPPCTPLNRC